MSTDAQSAAPPEGGADESRAGRVGERVRGLPTRTFGPASEEPYRRRTSDWVRVVVAVVAIALLVAYHDNPSNANLDLFRFFNGLPDDLQPLFQTLYWAGTLWIVLIVAAAALIARRWRLARDLTIAGCSLSCRRVRLGLFIDDKGLSDVFDAVTRLDKSPAFPLVRLAVVIAVVERGGPRT